MEQDDGRWLSGGYTRSIHKCNTPIPGFYGIQLHSLWQCNECGKKYSWEILLYRNRDFDAVYHWKETSLSRLGFRKIK